MAEICNRPVSHGTSAPKPGCLTALELCPEQSLIGREDAICADMKKTTLQNLIACLRDSQRGSNRSLPTSWTVPTVP
jgi:hypothetical protein